MRRAVTSGGICHYLHKKGVTNVTPWQISHLSYNTCLSVFVTADGVLDFIFYISYFILSPLVIFHLSLEFTLRLFICFPVSFLCSISLLHFSALFPCSISLLCFSVAFPSKLLGFYHPENGLLNIYSIYSVKNIDQIHFLIFDAFFACFFSNLHRIWDFRVFRCLTHHINEIIYIGIYIFKLNRCIFIISVLFILAETFHFNRNFLL